MVCAVGGNVGEVQRLGRDDRIARIERQLSAAQQIAHIGSWEWEIATNTVNWSDELYRIYGLEPQSCVITFDSFLARVHPDDRVRVQREVAAALERGGRFAYPERILRPDGAIRELESVGEVAHDDHGRVVGLIGTCRDVTEERQRDETIRLYADIVRNVPIGLSVWAVDGHDGDIRATLAAYNPASEAIARKTLLPWIGKTLAEIVPYAAGGQLESLLNAVARDGKVRETIVSRSRDPDAPAIALSVKAFPLPGRSVGAALEDITEAMLARRIQQAEHRALEMIASGDPLPEILSHLVLTIEDQSPPTIGSILLLDESRTRVRHGAAPNLPDEFNRAIEGQPIGPRAGSCGTAAFRRLPVFVADIETDPLWDSYREIARSHGLRACWSTPILATDGRVLGTFALYYRKPCSPTEADLALIARITHIARIAIERRELEDQLRALSGHVESVREDERTGIAREIHDELGQALTALKMDLSWIARRALGSGRGLSTEDLLEKVEGMTQMTDDLIDQVRRISAELRPGVLDDLGLVAGLEWQADEFRRRSSVICTVCSDLGELCLDRSVSTAIFRIFQEALTNVARHAGATRVEVTLDHVDGAVVLRVRDDGKGIAPEAVTSPNALGLLGIRERARRLGGTASIGPAVPCGTVVSIRVPLRERPAGDPR